MPAIFRQMLYAPIIPAPIPSPPPPPPPAPAYFILSGPNSVTVNSPTVYTVTGNNVTTQFSLSPISDNPNVVFEPSTLNFSSGETVKLFTATWSTTSIVQMNVSSGSIQSNSISVAVNTPFVPSPVFNEEPVWKEGTPSNLGVSYFGNSFSPSLYSYATDTESNVILFSRTGGSAPDDVTVNHTSGVVNVPNTLDVGTYSVDVEISDSSADITDFNLIGGGVGVPWSFGHVFSPGDVPAYLTAVDTENTISHFQADIRNRWPDGSAKFAVISGVGGKSLLLRRTNEVPLSGTVPLPNVSCNLVFESITDGNGQVIVSSPTTLTMPTNLLSCNFGLNIASHTAGLVRMIPGKAMTEYHYFSSVPGDRHLCVFWYVRAYVNGECEIETVVECTPWVKATGGGRRDYNVSVVINDVTKLSSTLVVQYAHTRWSRVDWVNSSFEVKPRHNKDYIRKVAFPHNNLPEPVSATNIIYGGDGSFPLAGNTYSEAMAPPINNPQNKLDWSNRIGSTGTSGSLRTIWESAYAAGLDCYWSAEAHARTAGRWDRIVRDEVTGRPFDITSPSNATTVGVAPFTGGLYNDGIVNNSFSASHAPPFGSGMYLLSGRWCFLEHMQMCTAATPLGLSTSSTRRLGYRLEGPYSPGTSITPDVRQGAWMQWGYINTTMWTPEKIGGNDPDSSDSSFRTSYVPYIENFCGNLLAAFRDGTIESGIYQNNLGIVGWSPGYLNTYIDSASAWGDSFMQNYLCFVLATACNMQLPLSVSGQSNLVALTEFALKRVVELGGTNEGWNWRRPYIHLPYGPDEQNGQPQMPPSSWYGTWLEVWNAAAPVLTTPTDTSDAVGGALFKFRGSTASVPWTPLTHLDRTEYDFNDNYLKQWSALALAVDLNVTGAREAWIRLQSSSTMTDARTAENLRNYPVTVYTPRSLD